MFKKVRVQLTSLIFLCLANSSFAEPGSLFTIEEDCYINTPYPVVICLDGKAPASCQNYIAHATNLRIQTTIPNQLYTYAGIKVLTPLFIPTNCTQSQSGYCLFSTSDTTSTTIIMTNSLPGFLTVC